jgi:hypothetical protein
MGIGNGENLRVSWSVQFDSRSIKSCSWVVDIVVLVNVSVLAVRFCQTVEGEVKIKTEGLMTDSYFINLSFLRAVYYCVVIHSRRPHR